MNHKRINKLLRSGDLFGRPIALTFYNKEKVQTTFGGGCSILFFCFVIWAIYNESQNLFRKLNPNVITAETFTEDPREMLLTEDNFPLAFGLEAPDTKSNINFKDKDIYDLELVHYVRTKTKKSDGTIQTHTEETIIDLEPCTLSHFGNMASNFAHFDLSQLYCIAKHQSRINKIYIQGSSDSTTLYTSISVRLLECDDTVAGNTCKPQATRKEYLSGAFFNVIYTNMVVDAKDYETPDSRFRDFYFTMINPNNYISSFVDLGHVTVTTDRGWITEELKTQSYIKVNDAKQSAHYAPHARKILINVVLQVSKWESVYTRSYDKIQNVLANVGSMVNTVFMIVFFLLGPYTQLKLREALMNKLFNIYTTADSVQEASRENAGFLKDPYKNLSIDYVEQEMVNLKSSKALESPLESPPLTSQPFSNQATLDDSPTQKFAAQWKENRRMLHQPSKNKTHHYPGPMKSSPKNDSTINMKNQSLHNLEKNQNENPMFSFGKPVNNFWTVDKSPKGNQKSKNTQIVPSSENLNLKVEEIDTGRYDIPLEVECKSPQSNEKINDPEKTPQEQTVEIHITFFEYIRSLIYMSKKLKKKVELLSGGVKSVNERLDILILLQKLRELDKLKILLLDENQFMLFNNLPKPEIRPESSKTFVAKKSFTLGLLSSVVLMDGQKVENNAYQNVKRKPEPTEIDRKLLEVFDKKKT